MEVFVSAWFLLLISCTDWFGVRQCVTLPVPTLNYYQGAQNQNNWNFKYQPSRYPGGGYYEKVTFPNKEPQAIISGESDKKIRQDSGKIFFPDEVSDPVKQDKKAYHFTDSDVRPIWKIRHRPTTSTVGSRMKQKTFDGIREMSFDVDGSTQSIEPKQLPDASLNGNTKNMNDIPESDRSEFQHKSVSAKLSKLNEGDRVRVAAAVEQFYDWLRKKESTKEKLAKTSSGSGAPLEYDKNCQPSGNDEDDDEAVNTTEHHISDQSLVAGLKDQKCPDGQVRLEETGECKVKVAV